MSNIEKYNIEEVHKYNNKHPWTQELKFVIYLYTGVTDIIIFDPKYSVYHTSPKN